MNNWQTYTPKGEFIPPEQWEVDHLGTLVYVANAILSHGGIVDSNKMRCNPRLHKEFANILNNGMIIDGAKYATRLKGVVIAPHDDWSCVDDMITAGLLTASVRQRENHPVEFRGFGSMEMKVSLTALGRAAIAGLMAHLANGGKYTDFAVKDYMS